MRRRPYRSSRPTRNQLDIDAESAQDRLGIGSGLTGYLPPYSNGPRWAAVFPAPRFFPPRTQVGHGATGDDDDGRPRRHVDRERRQEREGSACVTVGTWSTVAASPAVPPHSAHHWACRRISPRPCRWACRPAVRAAGAGRRRCARSAGSCSRPPPSPWSTPTPPATWISGPWPSYTGPVRTMVLGWKNGAREDLSEVMARLRSAPGAPVGAAHPARRGLDRSAGTRVLLVVPAPSGSCAVCAAAWWPPPGRRRHPGDSGAQWAGQNPSARAEHGPAAPSGRRGAPGGPIRPSAAGQPRPGATPAGRRHRPADPAGRRRRDHRGHAGGLRSGPAGGRRAGPGRLVLAPPRPRRMRVPRSGHPRHHRRPRTPAVGSGSVRCPPRRSGGFFRARRARKGGVNSPTWCTLCGTTHRRLPAPTRTVDRSPPRRRGPARGDQEVMTPVPNPP